MRVATVTLKSLSPYSQSRYHNVDKKDKENSKDYEARTWRDRVHVNSEGKIYIPPMCFKNALSEAAKYLAMQIPGKGKSTYTKHFEAGVLVIEPLTLPVKKTDVEGEWFFVPSDGKRGGGKRVEKCFPVIREWSGDVVFHILDDTITEEVFIKTLEAAGHFIGVGRFRPRNNGFYGRFIIDEKAGKKAVKWEEVN